MLSRIWCTKSFRQSPKHTKIPFTFKMAGDESGITLGQPHLSKQDLNSLVSVYLFNSDDKDSDGLVP